MLIAATVFAVNTCFAQNDWLLYKIDQHLMVKLPTDPRKLNGNTFIAITKDSTGCIVTRIDFKETAGLDSAGVAPLLDTKAFADTIRSGLVGRMKGFTLSEMKPGKLNGHYTYLIDGVNQEKKVNAYIYLVAAGQYLYSISALVKDGRGTKEKDYFFASVIIN
ncbi:MAG: hypothetical protein V4577_12720 [Bacteroidota bacterium]